jgi:purine-nucleoside phosphorylase
MRMPSRLRPTASVAADAILVGDPGRALLLAQELLEQPKMSNHARGLWGYSGQTPAGMELTIQSTGMGGPSAALVLGDLAKLGVRRAVRVGTCVGFEASLGIGKLLVVGEAIAEGGSAGALGVAAGARVLPDARLTDRLVDELVAVTGRAATIASYDAHPGEHSPPEGAVAADMQTAPLLARSRLLDIATGALLIVAETVAGKHLGKEALEEVEKRAGRVALAVLSA